MLSAVPYCQFPGEDTGLGWPPSVTSQMHIHISPVIVLLGFSAGGECNLMPLINEDSTLQIWQEEGQLHA